MNRNLRRAGVVLLALACPREAPTLAEMQAQVCE